MRRLDKATIRRMITHSYLQNRPIAFRFKDLMYPFGFKRMDGIGVLLTTTLTNKTEEQVQTAPIHEIHDNIAAWCKEENIGYYYDMQTDQYIFQ